MGWKAWPSWVKGGEIGLIISLVSLLLISISGNYGEDLPGFLVLLLAYLYFPVVILPTTQIIDNLGNVGGRLLMGLFLLVFYFLVGVVIGWIVGKLRNKS